MHLINVHSLKLEDFKFPKVPKYAILSHRWDDDEVTYKEWKKGKAGQTKGYRKIISACEQAKLYGLGYAWIDTCCIDRTSRAELGLSISNMYEWYQCSTICFVYLGDVDVPVAARQQHSTRTWLSEAHGQPSAYDTSRLCGQKFNDNFLRSAWFTRGWTLQELLAPRTMIFFDRNWQAFGSKQSLGRIIAEFTQIDLSALAGIPQEGFKRYSVATRMGWAASRETTLIEDRAYCLLGLFDVHMPLNYGSGEKAFRDFLEELIKKGDDDSVFLSQFCASRAGCLLPISPSEFLRVPCSSYLNGRRCHVQQGYAQPIEQLFRSQKAATGPGRSDFQTKHLGHTMVMKRPIFAWDGPQNEYLLPFRCHVQLDGSHSQLMPFVPLRYQSSSGRFSRRASWPSIMFLWVPTSFREDQSRLITSAYVEETLIIDDMSLDPRLDKSIMDRRTLYTHEVPNIHSGMLVCLKGALANMNFNQSLLARLHLNFGAHLFVMSEAFEAQAIICLTASKDFPAIYTYLMSTYDPKQRQAFPQLLIRAENPQDRLEFANARAQLRQSEVALSRHEFRDASAQSSGDHVSRCLSRHHIEQRRTQSQYRACVFDFDPNGSSRQSHKYTMPNRLSLSIVFVRTDNGVFVELDM